MEVMGCEATELIILSARNHRNIDPLNLSPIQTSDACLACGERHPTGDLAKHAVRETEEAEPSQITAQDQDPTI